MKSDNEKNDFADKINDFVQKNRKTIILSISVVFILIAGLIVFLSLQNVIQKNAISGADELNGRFEELRYYIGDENYAVDIEALLSDLNTFAKKHGGIAGSRAWSMIAQIHSGRQEWQQAEDFWLKAAKAGARTYLGPISLFNAAAAAEEQGKLEKAIELLQECINHKFEFPAAPRAQFSIGRLYEELNNNPAAIEAYRIVLTDWQNVSVWHQLARSRIIAIEIK
ncbi:MAG: tetratricopeptide repeat protein [Treponema sp.]|jgi:tetratricopeptide (TPR) repeat protein|nr:tetratricopeptide repeat protein [Treponema sp.]